MRRGNGAQVPATVIDRSLADSRTVAIVGPTPGLTARDVADRLAQAWTETARLRLIPDRHSRRWERASASAVPTVDEHPDLADKSPSEILTALRHRNSSDRPVNISVCGEWLAMDHSHGIGDGAFSLILISGLLYGDRRLLVDLLANELPPHAAVSALWRTFSRQPQRISAARELRAAHAPAEAESVGVADDWRARRQVICARMEPDAYAQLQKAIADTGVAMSSAAVTVSLLRAAFAEQTEIDPRSMVLIDARRYLADEHRFGVGNFAVGIPLRFADAGPVEVGTTMRAVAESGWPALTLAQAQVRDRLRPRTISDEDGASVVPGRLRLSVSDLGNPRVLTAPSGDVAPARRLYASVEPDGPDAVAALVTRIDGGLDMTATFSTDHVAAEAVSAALAEFCEHPERLFARVVDAR